MSRADSTPSAPPEKPDVRVAFIPIVCAAPLLLAHRHGLFAKNGLNVELVAAPGWSGVKELLVHDRIDAAHMLSPMPFACSLGIDGQKTPLKLLAIQNINGQALTLSARHRGVTRPSELKGLTFGVPYRFSMQMYLLCHWLASHGIDPMNEVRIIEVAPPRMPYYVETGRVDGVLAPEPYNEILVRSGEGVIFALSRDIWQGHPCCSLATTGRFFDANPSACRVLVESLIEAELMLSRADGAARAQIAREIADPAHLNQRDPTLVEDVLMGRFDDGRGARSVIPDRIDFAPYPFPEYGVWIMAQMQRWGQLRVHVDYDTVADAVMETRVAGELCEAAGVDPATFRASVERMPALSMTDTFESMRAAPFSAFQEAPPRPSADDLNEAPAARLSEIVSRLAAVAGGLPTPPFEVTGDDVIGELEQLLNEMLLNLRFTNEAVIEQRDRLERRVQERTVELERELERRRMAEQEVRTMNDSLGSIVAARTTEIAEKLALIEQQKEAIVALSTPIINVWRDVLALPIIGALDEERAADMTERLLNSVVRARSRFVILDLTGVEDIDAVMGDHLARVVRSVKLLGAEAIISGIRPLVSATMSNLDIDMSNVLVTRDLRQAIALCMRRVERPSIR